MYIINNIHICESVLITWSCLTHGGSVDYRPPGSSARGILQARILKWDAFLTPGDLPDPGIKPMSLVSPVDSLPLVLPGTQTHKHRHAYMLTHY